MIPGDGIGPEVTGAAVRIIESTGVKIDWESFKAGSEAFEKYREYIPKELVDEVLLQVEATFEKENAEREQIAAGMSIDEVYRVFGVL